MIGVLTLVLFFIGTTIVSYFCVSNIVKVYEENPKLLCLLLVVVALIAGFGCFTKRIICKHFIATTREIELIT